MEQKFESWVEEMISRMEIIDRKVKETGKLNGEATRLLMDRGIQPFGLWSPESETQASRNGKPTLTEIASEFGLTIDGTLLLFCLASLDDIEVFFICREPWIRGWLFGKVWDFSSGPARERKTDSLRLPRTLYRWHGNI